jgi:hypothetical protein
MCNNSPWIDINVVFSCNDLRTGDGRESWSFFFDGANFGIVNLHERQKVQLLRPSSGRHFFLFTFVVTVRIIILSFKSCSIYAVKISV